MRTRDAAEWLYSMPKLHWTEHALCGGKADVDLSRCHHCPVIRQCGAEALAGPEIPQGPWAGHYFTGDRAKDQVTRKRLRAFIFPVAS